MWLIVNDLIKNAILLFGLVFIYSATNYRHVTKTNVQNGLIGLVLGAVAILIMRYPWTLVQGVFFDTRNILYTAIGLYFGPVATLFAAIVGIVYRTIVGGSGVYSGVLTILVNSGLGLSWFYVRKRINISNRWLEYYLMGVTSTVLTLTCFLTIPNPIFVISQLVLPMLLIFPVVFMFLAKSFDNQKERIEFSKVNHNQKLLLQASIDSSKTMEIFALDTHLHYLSFNQYHAFVMRKHYQKDIQIKEDYMSNLKDQPTIERMRHYLQKALNGQTAYCVAELTHQPGHYVEQHFAPIKDESGKIIGLTVFSQDVTERKQYEKSILYLSYRDPLTNLYNRRYFNEELERLDQPQSHPLVLISGDINGLKLLNDAFGHDAGDLLLCTIADELIAVFKDDSKIARIGGDEFVILMPNSTLEQAELKVEQVRKKLEKHQIYGTKISVSFGFAVKDEAHPNMNLLKDAEDNMYSHKLFEFSSHRNETIKAIIHALHEKNPREEEHSNRVSSICRAIGERLGMKQDDVNKLEAISHLHDIGKIAIDDTILNKPGKLSTEEWELIKKHPEIGYRILLNSTEYADIAEDILSHHERFDGKGYPRAIGGEDIPLRARIIAIADAYDAMVSERPYRKPLTHQEAILEILINKGTQFDPEIADVFIHLFSDEAF